MHSTLITHVQRIMGYGGKKETNKPNLHNDRIHKQNTEINSDYSEKLNFLL